MSSPYLDVDAQAHEILETEQLLRDEKLARAIAQAEIVEQNQQPIYNSYYAPPPRFYVSDFFFLACVRFLCY